MRTLLLAMTSLIVLASGQPALAQEPEARKPATKEQIATATAEADRIIEAASAKDIFENVTGDDRPAVRHRASGMICTFFGAPDIDKILIFEDPIRGDDVGCSTSHSSGSEATYYATRYKPMPTEQAVLQSAVNAIRNRYPSAQPYESGLSSMGTEGLAPPIGAAFVINTTKGELFTMTLVSHREEWGFKLRASGPAADADTVNLMAQAEFIFMLKLRELPWD